LDWACLLLPSGLSRARNKKHFTGEHKKFISSSQSIIYPANVGIIRSVLLRLAAVPEHRSAGFSGFLAGH
jgi:hypothetical protein